MLNFLSSFFAGLGSTRRKYTHSQTFFKPLGWVQLYLKMTHSNRKKSMMSLHETLSPKISLISLSLLPSCMLSLLLRQAQSNLATFLSNFHKSGTYAKIDAWNAFFFDISKVNPRFGRKFSQNICFRPE